MPEIPGGCLIPPRDVDAAIRHTQEAKTWKGLAYQAFKNQLASKEKTPVSEGLSKSVNPSARKDRLAKA